MQFQVPQFIEVEDKIFGPFTFKQFVYMIGGAGLAFVIVRFVPFPFNYPFAFLAGGAGAAFAFVEIHKRPLIFFVEAAFWYLVHKKLYIWKKRDKKINKNIKLPSQGESPLEIPKFSKDKLENLAWGLDINEEVVKARLQEQLNKRADPEDDFNKMEF